VFGERDKVAPPSYAKLLTSRIPDSRSLVMADAGHMMTHEKPEEFAAVVTEFLESD